MRRSRRPSHLSSYPDFPQPLERRLLLSAGTRDSSFGSDGIATVEIPGSYAEVISSTADSNGNYRILVLQSLDAGDRHLIVGLAADGSLDASFGTNGFQVVASPGPDFSARGIGIQADGRLLIVGAAADIGSGDRDFVIQRLNGDGTSDNSFGTDGVVRYDMDSGSDEEPLQAVVTHSDGRIFAVGSWYDGDGVLRGGLISLTTAGAVNTEFDEDGAVSFSTEFTAAPGGLDLQHDHLLVGGTFDPDNQGITTDPVVYRFDTAGTPDAQFGDGTGKATLDVPNTWDDPTSFVVAESRIYLAYSAFDETASLTREAVVAFHNEQADAGALDTTFGTDGFLPLDLPNPRLGLDGSNRLVAGNAKRETGDEISGDFLRADRFRSDGADDSGFGSSGVARVAADQVQGSGNLLVDAADRVTLLGARARTGTDHFELLLTRLLGRSEMLRPEVTGPHGRTDNVSPKITWTDDPAAAEYEIYVSHMSGSRHGIIRESGLTSPEYQVITPLTGGRYRVWVRSHDGRGNSTLWSLPHDFTAQPAAPTLLTPRGATTAARPLFSWEAVAAADRYELYVSPVTAVWSPVIHETRLSTPEFRPESDIPSGRYRIWIRAFNETGLMTSYSTAADFQNAFGAPGNKDQTSAVVDRTPELTWEAVSGADTYEVWMNRTDRYRNGIIRESGLTAPSLSVTQALSEGTYRLWVRAFDAEGRRSSWSRPFDFRIDTSPLSVQAPEETRDATPEFSWEARDEQLTYQLWVNHSSGGRRIIYEPSLTTNQYTPAARISDGRVSIWVRALDAEGNATRWNSAAVTRIDSFLGQVNLTSPSGDTSSKPLLTWDSVENATRYDLWVNRLDVFTSEFIRRTDIAASQYQISSALAAGRYRFWVRALDEHGNSGRWSAPMSFNV